MKAVIVYARLEAISESCNGSTSHVGWNSGYLLLNSNLKGLKSLGSMGIHSGFKVTPKKKIRRRKVKGTGRPPNIATQRDQPIRKNLPQQNFVCLQSHSNENELHHCTREQHLLEHVNLIVSRIEFLHNHHFVWMEVKVFV